MQGGGLGGETPIFQQSSRAKHGRGETMQQKPLLTERHLVAISSIDVEGESPEYQTTTNSPHRNPTLKKNESGIRSVVPCSKQAPPPSQHNRGHPHHQAQTENNRACHLPVIISCKVQTHVYERAMKVLLRAVSQIKKTAGAKPRLSPAPSLSASQARVRFVSQTSTAWLSIYANKGFSFDETLQRLYSFSSTPPPPPPPTAAAPAANGRS